MVAFRILRCGQRYANLKPQELGELLLTSSEGRYCIGEGAGASLRSGIHQPSWRPSLHRWFAPYVITILC